MVTGLCTRNRNRVVERDNRGFGRVGVLCERFVSNERRLEDEKDEEDEEDDVDG
jgi:hypothetical protein